MFHLIQQVDSSLRGNQFDRLVREIAERSLAPARHRLSREAASMSPAELRGYVRARAAQPVRTEAHTSLAHHMQDTLLDELVPRALERTVHLIVRESMVQPVVAMPAAHVQRRAAA